MGCRKLIVIRSFKKHLRNLESEGLIIRTPVFTENGKQRLNKYTFNGKNTPLEETALTIDKLYDPDNPCGFRDWDWEDFKFIPGYYDENFSKEDSEISGTWLKRVKAEQQAKKDKFYGKK